MSMLVEFTEVHEPPESAAQKATRRLEAALRTLDYLKYEWLGGELWKPPLGTDPTKLPLLRMQYECMLLKFKMNVLQSSNTDLNTKIDILKLTV